jgi:nucleoid-associated protein YgaU
MFGRVAAIAGIAVVIWSIAARPTGAHGHKVVYRVQPYDTLWTIASAHYAGDVRDAVWRIERANRLHGSAVHPGERLVLP